MPEQTPSATPSFDPAQGASKESPEKSPDDYHSPWTGAPLKAVRNPNPRIKTKEVRKLVQPDFYPDDGAMHPELTLELYYKPRHWFLEATSLAAYLKSWTGHPLANDPEALTQAIGRDLAATVRYKVAVRCTFRLHDPDQTIVTSVYARPHRHKEDKQALKALKKARKAGKEQQKSAAKARKTEDKAQAKASKEAAKREKAARKAEKRATRQQPLPLLAYQAAPIREDRTPARSAPQAREEGAPTRTSGRRKSAPTNPEAPMTKTRGRRSTVAAESAATTTRSPRTSRRNGADTAATPAGPEAPRNTITTRKASRPADAAGTATRAPRTRRPRGTARTAVAPASAGMPATDKTGPKGSTD
ncbi:MAG: hypothetical protein Q4D19_12195 [Lautropia sp.]|nr:hypothetical protein [Lautropia sp.]